MTAEIISVGTELLLGQIVDTNASFLARTLADCGINLYFKTVVGDNTGRLASVIRLALSRSELVILGGGLGPTRDDLTKETVADVLGIRLVNDDEAETRLRGFFSQRGIRLPEANLKQALVFEGGEVFQNANGTAPGVAVEKDGKWIVCLPGPPNELIPMVRDSLAPLLRRLTGPDDGILVSRTIKLAGIGESLVAERLSHLMDNSDPTLAPYAKGGEVHLRITTRATDEAEALPRLDGMDRQISGKLGDHIFGRDEETLESAVLELCRWSGFSLAGAESCTGGEISRRLTSIPGSSDVFTGCAVTYANDAKTNLLGVRAETLSANGAVSEETAREMALGATKLFSADIAYATTGIAGPGGGTEEKQVGLVYMAVAGPWGVSVSKARFRGGRETIRAHASQNTLYSLWTALRSLNQER